ncbi:MAG TPA: efflux RND transporter periplasmic adaptor subunit [Rudaea sp.]|nr:efflux RND transporter periplasmic adaptor subunit [Rudaea sp.]
MQASSDNHVPSPRRLRVAGIAALIVALVLAAGGIALRVKHEHALEAKVAADAATIVNVIAPSVGESRQELVLPSNVQAFYDAPIYARVPGYLKKWYVDIGAKVKAGELLAEIETPELDQQLHQAEADLATAKAKEKLAEITAKRWQSMLASTSVSKQEADEKTGDYEAKQATVAAERANVERLQALASFKRIVAPFDGTITARKTDIGALINAGSGSGPELFRIADTHKLRVYVDVPQSYASQIEAGMQATLAFPEQPGKNFPARVVSTSNAIDPASRTLLVQLEADNAQGKLIAGSYANVHFDLPAATDVLQLPVTALLFRQHGLKVATVGADGRAVLKNIQLGRDFGTRVEVVSGIDASDRVIDSPPDWLAQGDPVRAAQPEPARAPGKSVAAAEVRSP